jgi:hypothetical protein
MMIVVIAAFAGMALKEMPGLIKGKQWSELVVFSILFIFALTLSVLQTLGIEITSPVKGIIYLLKNILHISYP